jgi:hypothetical protein
MQHIKLVGFSSQEVIARHAELGWQCPECFGIQIEAQTTRFDPQPTGFLCTECGCQFGSR